MGLNRDFQGEIYLEDKILKVSSISERISDGIVLVPEDRQGQGLVQSLSMKSADKNINLETLCLENEVISNRLSKEEILEIFDFEFYLRYTKQQFISLGWKID